MNFSLKHAQLFKHDFAYLIGTSQCFSGPPSADLLSHGIIRGIVVVGDDGACIDEQMQADALEKTMLDDACIIRKPWLFKYRVYLIHAQLDDPTTLYYGDLAETLEQLGISFSSGRYHD